jgi:hypothetical protein
MRNCGNRRGSDFELPTVVVANAHAKVFIQEALCYGPEEEDFDGDSTEQSMKDRLYEATTGRLTIMVEQFRVEDSYARRYGIDAGAEKGKETSNKREIESPAKEKSKKQK